MNPWLILGAVLAAIGLAVGVGNWQHGAGVTEERDRNRGVQIEELKTANATIERLNREARATEHQHGADLAQIGETHAIEMQNAELQRRRDVAAARDGSLKLRVPGGCKGPGSSPPSEAQPAAGGSDAPQGSELPAEVTANLFALADDADAVVKQLTAAQAVIRADQKACGESHADIRP